MRFKKFIFPTIFLLYLAFLSGYFRGRIKALEERNSEQDLIILSQGKQIPYIAKYIALVKLISERETTLTPFEIAEISRIIIQKCYVNQSIGLEPSIVLGLIERESNFQKDAISTARAYGLCQVIRTTAEIHLSKLGYGDFSIELVMNPIVNIEIGIDELVRLRKMFLSEGINSWHITLTAYFWGERNTRELLLSKKRANLPSLEYGYGIMKLAEEWKIRGLS